MSARKGVITLKDMQKKQGKHGFHAVVPVGYKDNRAFAGGGYLIIKNSWGRSWGDDGFGYLPYGYCSTEGFICRAREVPGFTFRPPEGGEPKL